MDTASEMVSAALGTVVGHGDKRGQCGLCGRVGDVMLAANYRDTFTGGEFLHDTGLMCPACYAMYNDNQFRYSNWVCHPGGFAKLKPPEVLVWFLSFEGPFPFVFYTTNTYKKQGWIRLLRALNYSTRFAMVGWDMNLVTLNVGVARRHADIIHQFVSMGIKKGFLMSGVLPGGVLKRVPAGLVRRVVAYHARHKDDLAWRWVVNFYPMEGYQPVEPNIEVLLDET